MAAAVGAQGSIREAKAAGNGAGGWKLLFEIEFKAALSSVAQVGRCCSEPNEQEPSASQVKQPPCGTARPSANGLRVAPLPWKGEDLWVDVSGEELREHQAKWQPHRVWKEPSNAGQQQKGQSGATRAGGMGWRPAWPGRGLQGPSSAAFPGLWLWLQWGEGLVGTPSTDAAPGTGCSGEAPRPGSASPHRDISPSRAASPFPAPA